MKRETRLSQKLSNSKENNSITINNEEPQDTVNNKRINEDSLLRKYLPLQFNDNNDRL